MNMSYTKFLKVIIRVAYYGSILALVGTGIAFTLGLVKPQNKFLISVETPLTSPNTGTFDEPGWAGRVSGGNNLRLTFTELSPAAIQEHIGLYVSIALSTFLGMVLLVFIARQLMQIVDTLGTPEVFSQANVVRIRLLGGLLIALEFIKPFIWLFIRNDVLDLMSRNDIPYGGENLSFGLSDWGLAGLLILGLAEVFRSGQQLKQESELTI